MESHSSSSSSPSSSSSSGTLPSIWGLAKLKVLETIERVREEKKFGKQYAAVLRKRKKGVKPEYAKPKAGMSTPSTSFLSSDETMKVLTNIRITQTKARKHLRQSWLGIAFSISNTANTEEHRQSGNEPSERRINVRSSFGSAGSNKSDGTNLLDSRLELGDYTTSDGDKKSSSSSLLGTSKSKISASPRRTGWMDTKVAASAPLISRGKEGNENQKQAALSDKKGERRKLIPARTVSMLVPNGGSRKGSVFSRIKGIGTKFNKSIKTNMQKLGLIEEWVFHRKDCQLQLNSGKPVERFRAAIWMIVLHSKSQEEQVRIRFKLIAYAKRLRKKIAKHMHELTRGGTQKKVAEQLKQFQQGIWKAVKSGDMAGMKNFIRKPGFNHMMRGTFGETILHTALLFKNDDCAAHLIKNFPTLINAIYKHDQFRGETALHIAIVNQNAKMVKLLVEAKAAVNGVHAIGIFFQKEGGTVYYGETPLHFAVSRDSWNIAKYLITEGADLEIPDKHGNTVFHFAVYNELREIYGILAENAIRIYGQDRAQMIMNAENYENMSPLKLAAYNGSFKMTKYLLDRSRIVCWSWGPVSLDAYPIEEIEPSERSEGVLQLVVRCGHSELIRIDIIKNLLVEKWKNFGRPIFYSYGTFVLLMCGFNTYFFVSTNFKSGINNDTYSITWMIFLLMSIASIFVRFGFAIWDHYSPSFVNNLESNRDKPQVAKFFADCFLLYNILTIVGVSCFMAGADDSVILSLLGPASIFLWIFFLKFVMIHEKVGQFVISIVYIGEKNVRFFGVIYMMLIFALSAPMARYYGEHDYRLWVSELFFISIGFEPSYTDEPEHKIPFFSIQFIFGVLHIIVLLNLLIAVMAETIGEVTKEADMVQLQTWADVVLETERLCPNWMKGTVGIRAEEAGMPVKDPTTRVMPRLVTRGGSGEGDDEDDGKLSAEELKEKRKKQEAEGKMQRILFGAIIDNSDEKMIKEREEIPEKLLTRMKSMLSVCGFEVLHKKQQPPSSSSSSSKKGKKSDVLRRNGGFQHELIPKDGEKELPDDAGYVDEEDEEDVVRPIMGEAQIESQASRLFRIDELKDQSDEKKVDAQNARTGVETTLSDQKHNDVTGVTRLNSLGLPTIKE